MNSFGPPESESPLPLPATPAPAGLTASPEADPRKAAQIAALFRNDGSETDRQALPRSGAMGRIFGRVIVFAVLLSIVVGGSWAAAKYSGLFDEKAAVKQMTHKVERGDLVITVTQKGNVESAANIEIRCLVAGGGIIKDIVTDGTIVKEGDQLVELDSAAIDEQILQQRIGYEKARAIRDQAKNDLEAAKIALREYVEGTFKKEVQIVDGQITIAEENLRSAQNTLLYTERMFRKAYVTPLQLEAQQFAVKRAQLELDTAKTAKRVLEEFTYLKMKNDLETQVATAGAKASSEQTAFELEESKLKRLETQKLNCLIAAPQNGMVVYANDSGGSRFGGSSDRPKIEEGATVREGQVILRVPDLRQMQVRVTVHESKVESLKAGMPASIRIQNRKLTGYVTFIANQPESTSMFSANVKEYAAFVRVDGEQHDLKPGMTAEVEILVDEKKGVLTVPVQCIVEQAGRLYAWRETPQGFEKTEIKLGTGDDRKVEVISGLSENDVVLQNPPERSEGNFATSPGSRSQFGAGPRGTKPSGEAPSGGAPSDGAPAANGATPGSGAGQGGPAGSRPSGGRSMDVMSFDKDGDGKVSRAEAPEQMQAFFDRMDGDADGFISAAEAAAARARRASQGGAPGGVPGGGGPGT
ncbi:MAG: hypothetical protein C0483_06390 [Pirellula sp.]|nr:hypothetical protein [Pirellula sp.]